MEAWAREVIDLWQANRVDIAKGIFDGIANNPDLPVKYSMEDILQMVDGARAMIVEELEAHGSEIRDTYMNSVIPGILSQGQPLTNFVGQITMNAVIVFNLLVPRASDQHRQKIATYLTNWYVKLNSEIVKVGLEVGSTS